MELKINGNKIFAPLKNKELVLTPVAMREAFIAPMGSPC